MNTNFEKFDNTPAAITENLRKQCDLMDALIWGTMEQQCCCPVEIKNEPVLKSSFICGWNMAFTIRTDGGDLVYILKTNDPLAIDASQKIFDLIQVYSKAIRQ